MRAKREERLFRIGDAITTIEREERLVAEELTIHRHLDDDARRDAAVSDHPMDRADARETAGDVARFEDSLRNLAKRKAKLIARREKLLRKL